MGDFSGAEQDGRSVSEVEGCVDFVDVEVRISRCFLLLSCLPLVSLDLKWWPFSCRAGVEPRNASPESVSSFLS